MKLSLNENLAFCIRDAVFSDGIMQKISSNVQNLWDSDAMNYTSFAN